jgi:hypothetical protein
MAEPVDRPPGHNHTFQAPTNEEGRVRHLDVVRVVIPGDPPIPAIYSQWRLSWPERLMVLLTGKMWYSVWGTRPAPASIGAGRRFAPFKVIQAVEAMKAASERKH